jgi:hypothetical protein
MNNRAASTGLKLGCSGVSASTTQAAGGRLTVCGAVAAGATMAAVLAGCAEIPTEPVSEKLDPDTATTVTVINRPIELLSQTDRSRKMDPFAYIAPFETNRMGTRDLFLWVSTPQAQGPLTPPQVICNGQPLKLQPLSQESSPAATPGRDAAASNAAAAGSADTLAKVDLSKLSLSRAPYDAPVPWSTQWYFRLPADGLKCLADADGISLQAKSASGGPDQFIATGRENLASLDAFTRR